MTVKEVAKSLESLAPIAYAEGFDNVGLQVGDFNAKVDKILVTLDITEQVMQEAIAQNAQMIITFHPLIFKGLKKLTQSNRVERLVAKAIQHQIAIYAIHTNLDNQVLGVNHAIMQRLGIENAKILIPKQQVLYRLTFYVPHADADKVKQAIYQAGGGEIGNYSQCSFNVQGNGTFLPSYKANPTLGENGKVHTEPETQVDILVQKHVLHPVLNAMKQAHPYEEVAYFLTELENMHQELGMGQIGELDTPMDEQSFLNFLKKQLPTACIRHSDLLGKPVQKVAVLGGSGSFAIAAAKNAGADVFVTADLKYHDFFLAENQIILADVGHFESEQFTKNLLTDYLSEKFPNFAVLNSNVSTNPINYL